MPYCKLCGAELPEGTRFCPDCGAVTAMQSGTVRNVQSVLPDGLDTQRQPARRKPVYKRWWFWILILVVISSAVGRRGLQKDPTEKQGQGESTVITTPETPDNIPAIPETPSDPEPTSPSAAEDEIRPEFKEFLDAYEAYMDEYVAFMQKYSQADPEDMVAMMGDYTAIMTRYAEFAEKMEAVDEEELTNAELAYYLEVTDRVNQKLLTVAGG